MGSLNRVFLMGNLTKDPELRYTASAQPVANLRMAINHNYRTPAGELKEEVCFLNVVVWGKQAESCGQYLVKGSPILVEGRLQNRNWETEDKQKRSTLEVVALRVQFLGRTKGATAHEEAVGGGGHEATGGGGHEPAESGPVAPTTPTEGEEVPF